ncbi:MAG: molecular chaperone SurA [Rubrivivax sp. SCN 70-15]|nr:MAG: molecular chaperone SurA [Rubrivivax sp. SCN 70-15]
MTEPKTLWRRLVVALALVGAIGAAAPGRAAVRNGDYIVAIVNSDLVTAGEVDRRVQRAEAEALRSGAQLPPLDQLRKQVLDSLINERVIVTHARESGIRVDDADVDRAVQSVAAQNQLTTDQLRQRLRDEGMDYRRFREQLRDQLLVERVREREVYQSIKVDDAEIDAYLAKQRATEQADPELDIAQILVTVPDGADAATVAARKAVAEAALARVRAGEDFASVAKAVSEDGNRARGGDIGLRPASRLPDLFVAAVRDLKPGQITPGLVRSSAGFHILKLVQRKDNASMMVTQTHVRHILLRTSPELSTEVAIQRLAEMRREIESGKQTFGDLARKYSEDGSAAAGGDLGWASPGTMVPEFEQAMDQTPVGGISPPVVSRFGVHLIQVVARREVALDKKELREQARNALREQKFQPAYEKWLKDLRAQAYIEMREPPQ